MPLTTKELRDPPPWETRDWKTESRKSGVLRLRVQDQAVQQKDFVDADAAPLEERLTDVLVHLLRRSITVEERDRRAEVARQAEAETVRRRHEEELRRWELEEQRRKERARIAALIEGAAKWRQADDIRAYVAVAGPNADVSWVTWALAVADSLDPLVVP